MKITIGGKWEIELGRSYVSPELEAAVKEAVQLTNTLDHKVEDTTHGNDRERGHSGSRKNK